MSARILSRSIALAVTTMALLAALLAGTTTSASAAYTTAGTFAGGKVQYLMCKTAVDSGYGPLWKVQLVMATSHDYSGSATYRILRGGRVVGTRYLSARNGAWDVETVYLSRHWGDTWQSSFGAGQISTGYGAGSTMSAPTSMSRVAYC